MDNEASDSYFEVTVDADVSPRPIAASGELDAASSAALGKALETALADGSGICLDLAKVTFIDSSALRVVTLAVRRAEESGQPFTVSAASDAVRRIFEITGVSSLLDL